MRYLTLICLVMTVVIGMSLAKPQLLEKIGEFKRAAKPAFMDIAQERFARSDDDDSPYDSSYYSESSSIYEDSSSSSSSSQSSSYEGDEGGK